MTLDQKEMIERLFSSATKEEARQMLVRAARILIDRKIHISVTVESPDPETLRVPHEGRNQDLL